MFSSRIGLAVPGVELKPGDHICAFYPSLGERDSILVPYIREGLEAGDKCVCVIDGPDVGGLAEAFGAAPDRPVNGRPQLDMRRSEDTYLAGGAFSMDAMIDFWDASVGGAVTDEGFEFARAAGEMTWALRHMPGVEDLIVYESLLNRFLPKYPQVIMCLYELGRFSGEVLVDVLKTHPKVLLGGMLLDNPYYLDPDEFLSRHG
jgi:hypothetical protein